MHTVPQYPVEKYKLDLAVILDDDRKLDIEVDGESTLPEPGFSYDNSVKGLVRVLKKRND